MRRVGWSETRYLYFIFKIFDFIQLLQYFDGVLFYYCEILDFIIVILWTLFYHHEDIVFYSPPPCVFNLNPLHQGIMVIVRPDGKSSKPATGCKIYPVDWDKID